MISLFKNQGCKSSTRVIQIKFHEKLQTKFEVKIPVKEFLYISTWVYIVKPHIILPHKSYAIKKFFLSITK